MERINFNKKVQMHLACSKDDYHPIMQYVYFKDGCKVVFRGRNKPIIIEPLDETYDSIGPIVPISID